MIFKKIPYIDAWNERDLIKILYNREVTKYNYK
jgi:hypothetical protein